MVNSDGFGGVTVTTSALNIADFDGGMKYLRLNGSEGTQACCQIVEIPQEPPRIFG